MPQKPILVPARLRRPPATGWSWMDRRFVREHMAHLSREAVLLYFFLAAVADKHGLSFYADGTLATLLRMTLPALIQARNELLDRDLIAHEARFTQVLSLLPPGQRRRSEPGGGLMQLGDILRRAVELPHSDRGKELAMNVALWAEIRRLAEIEKLSGRAISRRLHCSRHTVAAALDVGPTPREPGLALRQPPGRAHGQDRRPARQVSRPLGGAHPRGDRSRPRRLYRQRHSSAATCGRSALRAVASTRKSTTSRPRRCRSIGASAAACESVTRPARSRCSWPCSAIAG